jgi:hypothetical protein
MKSKQSKDLISILLLGLVMVGLGVLLVNYFGKGSKSREETVEMYNQFVAEFDESGKTSLKNTDEVTDYIFPIDLNTGFGNDNPFLGND